MPGCLQWSGLFAGSLYLHKDAYCAFVMEQLAEARKHCSDPIVLVEQRLDFSKWVPEGFGTGDACIVADDVLHVMNTAKP